MVPRKAVARHQTADEITRDMTRRLSRSEGQVKQVQKLNEKYETYLNRGGKAGSYKGYIGVFPRKKNQSSRSPR